MELFNGLAPSYDRTVDLATMYQDRRWKKWLATMAQVGKGDLVLDVGCGTQLLEERLQLTGGIFVGLDLTERMIKIGMAKRLPNVALVVNGDGEAIPIRDRTFDVLITCYVAKYVDLPKFVRELARVVKPGGRVVLYDFVRLTGPFSPFLAVYVKGVMRMVGFFLGLAKSEVAFTYKNLPRIVELATWDRSLLPLMEGSGFRTLAFQRLTSGVVVAYCGVARGK